MSINSINSPSLKPVPLAPSQTREANVSTGVENTPIVDINGLEDSYNNLTAFYDKISTYGLDAQQVALYLNNWVSKYKKYLDDGSKAAYKDLINKLWTVGDKHYTPEEAKALGLDADLQTLRMGCLKAAGQLESNNIKDLMEKIKNDGYYTAAEVDQVVRVLYKITDAFPPAIKESLGNLFDSLDDYFSKGEGDLHIGNVDQMYQQLKGIADAAAELGNSKLVSQQQQQQSQPQLNKVLIGRKI